MVRNLEAKRSAGPPIAPKTFSLISDSKLKQLYAAMLQCRMLDDRLRALPARSKLRHLSSAGYEAAVVGAAIDLRRDDWLIPQSLYSAARFIKGVSLATIFPEPERAVTETARMVDRPAASPPPRLNVVPPIASISAQVDVAIGMALAARSRKKGSCVMVFCDATPSSPAQLRPSLEFAARERLALLIVVRNYSSSNSGQSRSGPPRKKTPAASSLISQAHTSGIPVIPVDYADVVAMYRVAFESIHKARHNGGPTVIEAATWTLPAKSRSGEREVATDPIARMEDYLVGKALFSDRWKQSLIHAFHRELEAVDSSATGKRK